MLWQCAIILRTIFELVTTKYEITSPGRQNQSLRFALDFMFSFITLFVKYRASSKALNYHHNHAQNTILAVKHLKLTCFQTKYCWNLIGNLVSFETKSPIVGIVSKETGAASVGNLSTINCNNQTNW